MLISAREDDCCRTVGYGRQERQKSAPKLTWKEKEMGLELEDIFAGFFFFFLSCDMLLIRKEGVPREYFFD